MFSSVVAAPLPTARGGVPGGRGAGEVQGAEVGSREKISRGIESADNGESIEWIGYRNRALMTYFDDERRVSRACVEGSPGRRGCAVPCAVPCGVFFKSRNLKFWLVVSSRYKTIGAWALIIESNTTAQQQQKESATRSRQKTHTRLSPRPTRPTPTPPPAGAASNSRISHSRQ